jgi:alpha-L-fucosidase
MNDRKDTLFLNHCLVSSDFTSLVIGCGIVPDFDTPEYATFGATQSRKWETSEGMDPNSYGLNTGTDPGQYKNGTTIIHTLVDVVSKNGN